MRKRIGHKPAQIRSGRHGGVECGGTIIGLGETTKKWMVGGEYESHALSILRIKLGMRE